MKFIEHLKHRLELFLNQTNSIKENSHLTSNRIDQIRAEANERIRLRNGYYRQKFPVVLEGLSLLTSKQKHLQLIEKQHYRSKQFFKKIFNIQSLIDTDQYHQQYEQSIKCLNELKSTVQQYETDLGQMRGKLLEQNQELQVYSSDLFQIQLEQNEIRSNIEQLKAQILFENRLYSEMKFTLQTPEINEELSLPNDFLHQLHTEYLNLSAQITQTKFQIEQNSIDLLPLQFELYIYHTILNVNDIHSMKCTDQPFLLPTNTINTEQIPLQSATVIKQLTANIVQADLQQVPNVIQSKAECIKIKSRKSKGNFNGFFFQYSSRL